MNRAHTHKEYQRQCLFEDFAMTLQAMQAPRVSSALERHKLRCCSPGQIDQTFVLYIALHSSMTQNILVVGTGAIGGFFASRFASVAGTNVSVVCRSNYNAVLNGGLRVTSPLFGDTTFRPTFTFANPDDARAHTQKQRLSWHWLLISTKVLPELGDPSQLLEGLVDKDSSIVLMQNGLGIEAPYHKRFPHSPIVSATTR